MISQRQKIKDLEAEVASLKSSVNELKLLNEIALTSGRATDIDQVLNLIVQKCVTVIEAEQGSILLVTENEEQPFKTIVRQDDSSSLKHAYRIGTNITGWVLLNREPLIIENLSKDKRFNPSEEEKREIHSALCVPIWYEGEITGLMMLVNKKYQKYFSPNDLTLFTIISVQAGQLIKNLDLQRENFERIKETEKLNELDKLKTNFFTNISHEFRTPLTLIIGPAKQILEQTESDKVKENARLIQRSAKKLNMLADQLLDLARIEAGMMKLRTSRQNLLTILKEIINSFQSFAESKNISLKFNPEQKEIYVYLDRDKIEKIMSNILSNAFKFTPQGGEVEVAINFSTFPAFANEELNRDFLEISILDTGIGIPKKQLDKIFDRFYQVDNIHYRDYQGTGIGLSLTKELVELHKGKILVESEEGKGSAFKVYLPLGKENFLAEEIISDAFVKNKNELTVNKFPKKTITNADDNNCNRFEADFDQNATLPQLLIIEDNSEIRNYISEIMKKQYKIMEAVNGKDGLNKSFELIPDIIISDVMMPEIDGFQLCSNLKTDNRTSHIPLILLTAKATIKDKIEGLETGADDYIMKPFEADELKARIKNLLSQRKRIHDYFQRHGLFEINDCNITSIDKTFLNKVVEVINDHIRDISFDVESFAKNMAVSKSLLTKKLIALTGESPGEFIKRCRLNKAIKMLEHKSGNITEIAFECGFNDASYFTACFKKQFGITPSKYIHGNSC